MGSYGARVEAAASTLAPLRDALPWIMNSTLPLANRIGT